MAIIAKSGASFTPAPAGTHAAVCVDVVDLGMVETSYSGKKKSAHKINIVWQIDEYQEDGKPFYVRRRYTLSLHEKAGLRKDLESWRGRQFTPEELKGFDVETVLGVPCMLSVIHETREGSTYANVNGVMRLPKGMVAPSDISAYVRVKDRPTDTPSGSVPPQHDDGYAEGIDDSDVPF